MAQLVVSAAGAAVGFMVGGPVGAQIGWAAGSIVGAVAFPPDATKVAGPRLDDLKVGTSTYGSPIPYIKGTVRVAGSVVWASNKREISHTTSTGGGKGGGGGVESTSYTYECDLMILLADNEIPGVSRIWKDGALIWDHSITATDESVGLPGSVFERAVLTSAEAYADLAGRDSDKWTRMTVYKGGQNQMPDPCYEAAVGTANASAYRGRGMVFIQSLQLGSGGNIPNLTFEIDIARPPVLAVYQGNLLVLNPVSGVCMSVHQSQGATAWPDFYGGYREYENDTSICYVPALDRFFIGNKAGQVERFDANLMVVDDIITMDLRDKYWHQNSDIVAQADGQYIFVNTVMGGVVTDWGQEDINVYRINTSTHAVTTFTFAVGHAANDMSIHKIQVNAAGTRLYLAWFQNVGTYPSVTSYSWYSVHDAITGAHITTVGRPIGGTNWNNIISLSRDGTRMYWGNGNAEIRVMNPETGADIAVMTVASDCYQVVENFAGTKGFFGGAGLTCRFDTATLTVEASVPSLGKTPYWFTMGLLDSVVYTSSSFIGWAAGNIGSAFDPATLAYTPFRYGTEANTSLSRLEWAWSTDDRYQSLTVASLVSKLCLRAGLKAEQFDVTALLSITQMVRGIAVSQVGTTRNVLEILMAAYFFNATLSDKIYFRPLGSNPVATIPYDALGFGGGDAFALKRGNELEIPAQMAITFLDKDADYEPDTEYSDRLITSQTSVNAQQMPLVFSRSEGKAIATARLVDAVAANLKSQIAIGLDYARLEPTDVILVTDERGDTFRFRITTRGEDSGVITLNLEMDDPSALQQVGVTTEQVGTHSAIAYRQKSRLAIMDIPILRDLDDHVGLYTAVAPAGNGNGWTSAAVYGSVDDLLYSAKVTISSQTVIANYLYGLWYDPPVTSTFDDINEVWVEVKAPQQLSSVTRAELLNDSTLNVALVGREIVQYQTATLSSENTYILTGLLRGRRGTEHTMLDYAEDVQFVKLGMSGMRFLPLENTDLGSTQYYRPVSAGGLVADAATTTIIPMGVSMKPFSGVDGRANRNTADTVVTWKRRTRLATRLVGALPISCPLGEATEAYEAEVWDSGFATLKRTFTGLTTSSFTYTLADQTADFGGAQTELNLRIYQMSASVGRGQVFETVI